MQYFCNDSWDIVVFFFYNCQLQKFFCVQHKFGYFPKIICSVLLFLGPFVYVLLFPKYQLLCFALFRFSSSPCSRLLGPIGLYRDVWIAAIASSRTRLATLTGAMCKTSQYELRSIRVNSGMLNVIRIVTYYTLPPLESPTSSWIAMAFWR